MKVPTLLWNLLVPSAACGGSPTASSAGTVINPPPPAMESMKPPASPAKKRRARWESGMRAECLGEVCVVQVRGWDTEGTPSRRPCEDETCDPQNQPARGGG